MVELDKRYYINVGDNGTFKPSGNHTYDTTAADVDKIIEELKSRNNHKKILLYFHGGLVNAENGMQTAARIYNLTKDSETYPIAFVWETGLKDTLVQNLDTIYKSEFFKKLLVKIVKVSGAQLGIDLQGGLGGTKGVGNMTDEEIEAELTKNRPFEGTTVDPGKRSTAIIATTDPDVETDPVIVDEVTAALDEEIQGDFQLIALAEAEKPEDEAKLMKMELIENTEGTKGIVSLTKLIAAAVKITLRVIKRHLKKRDHDFYPTLIEEILREIYVDDIGCWVWTSIKKKASDVWTDNDFTGDPADWYAGSYLLKKLNDYQDEVGLLTIDLAGHSAGSEMVCNLVKTTASRYSDLKFRKIILMAPACRCELFSDTLLKNTNRFESLKIFTMSDEFETKDHMVKVLYTRSLLYFISGVLEKNESDAFILGLQRHISNNSPYDREAILTQVYDYLSGNKCMVYAQTLPDAVEGARSMANFHAGFDDEGEVTLDSLLYLIK